MIINIIYQYDIYNITNVILKENMSGEELELTTTEARNISIGIMLPVILIGIGLIVWNAILIMKKWKYLQPWARVLYILLWLTGVGPIPSIILLYIGVGVSSTIVET